MNKPSHAKRRERRTREKSEHRRRLTGSIAAAVVLVLAVAWSTGFAVMHAKTTVEKEVVSFDATLVANRTEDLPNVVEAGAPSYPAYTVVHSGSTIIDHVYVVTVQADRPAVWYERLFLPSRTLSLAVYMNQFDSIQKVWALSPSVGELPARDFREFLDRWPGRTYYELIDPANAYQYPDGGAYAVPIRKAMRELAGSVYKSRYGQAAYEKLLIGVGSAGLQIGKSLPAFEVRATDGTAVSQTSLVGTKSVVMSVTPYCGSCYDATVALMKNAYKAGNGKWRLVVIASTAKDDDRLQALIKDLPQGTLVIADADQTLSHKLYMYASPYVVMLDARATVQYRGSGYKLDDAAHAASDLAALP